MSHSMPVLKEDIRGSVLQSFTLLELNRIPKYLKNEDEHSTYPSGWKKGYGSEKSVFLWAERTYF